MVEFDTFRRNLATLLLDHADRRRRSLAGGLPTGEDLKIVTLFERLAADAENLDAEAFLTCRRLVTQRLLARSFLQRRDQLLAQIGVLYCPADATDLVRWMTHQLGQDHEGPRSQHDPGQPAPPSPGESQTRGGVPEAPTARVARPGLVTSLVSDFAAGFGMVAPFLAVWETSLGVAQWRDQATAQANPAVPATVIASELVDSRIGATASNTVLTFQPAPTSPVCRVAVRIGGELPGPTPGATIMVVPRSPDCETPLIASELGHPLTTFVFSALLLIGGLASLKLWTVLSWPGATKRSRPPQSAHPARA